MNANGVDVTGNGANITLNGTNVSLVNSTSHGVVVSSTQTLITGGTSSTSLQLDDIGARFSDSSTGGAAKVTGVADGTSTHDAVNFGQLQALEQRMSAGIAATSAMANIPPLEQGKKFAMGVGIGHFNGSSSVAIGGNYRLSPNAVFRASVGINGGRKNVFGAGASFSW